MFLGEGIGDDGTWPLEQGILVLGIEREAAVQLGRRFGQRAIVCGELGGLATLALCDEVPEPGDLLWTRECAGPTFSDTAPSRRVAVRGHEDDWAQNSSV